ncbi:hypothetical protein ACFSLT_18490 [Novosphingobium resinovorum]
MRLTHVPKNVRLILGRTATVTIEQHDGEPKRQARPVPAPAAAPAPAATQSAGAR